MWCGVVWCGVVWCGVWYGFVRLLSQWHGLALVNKKERKEGRKEPNGPASTILVLYHRVATDCY